MRAFDEVAAGRLQVAGERLVGAEYQMQRSRQHERRFAVDQRQRCVSGQADDGGVVGVADVIAAERAMRQRLAIVAGRAHPNRDARQPGDRLDDAIKLRRPEHAAELPEPRREIRDPHLGAVAVRQDGGNDRGVADILRLKIDHVLKHDVREAFFFAAGQQAAENRIAVEPRIAPPHDARAGIDQRRRAAIADHRQIEAVVDRARGAATRFALGTGRSIFGEDREIVCPVVHGAAPWFSVLWRRLAMRASQPRTDSGFSKWPLTSATTRPTEKPKPPNWDSMGNTGSSVVSSPTKIGVRPLNGGYVISSRTALALLMPAILTSKTSLPGSTSIEPRGAPAQMSWIAVRRVSPLSGANR
jgi:hypothetical protein